ncbi:MAG TPA: beta-N-acetylhexosaminidase [Thermotogota bacterium]|nr:beta-N-acetylhexosaminidase [Thermotogota bacterium]
MTLQEKIGRLFLIGIQGKELTDETRDLLDRIQPGFIILFQRNVESGEQLKRLITDIKNYVGRELVFAIDQEGGIVTRLEEGFTISPGAMALSATNDPENAYRTGRILGSEMRALGISWDLAPVVDVNDNYRNRSTGVRAFGDTPQRVAEYSQEFYRGLREEGVAATAKHFPGNGSIEADPHLDMPVLNKTLEELMQNEFIPFQNVIDKGIESVMISHVYLPQVMRERLPSAVSKEVMKDLLIGRLGFRGILVSDDLTMGGVANFFDVDEASYQALMAGMDVIDICHESANMFRAFDYLVKKAQEEECVMAEIDRAFEKVSGFIEHFNVPVSEMNLEKAGTEENLNRMDEITAKAITVYKNSDEMIPLNNLGKEDLICAVRPLRQSLVEEEREGSSTAGKLHESFPETEFIQFNAKLSEPEADELLKGRKGRKAVVLTENAYLFPGQKKLVLNLLERYEQVLLVALRNPYDAGISGIDNAVLSYGYSIPNQKNLVKALFGEIKASGICPVPIPEID